MSEFLSPLYVEVLGKNKFLMLDSFRYHIGKYPSEEFIEVPELFITDFASVPRIFWMLIGPIDNHAKAAVVHDYLYKTKYFKRKKCDLIFKEMLEVLNAKEWKIFCMYWSVRLFGWNRYNKEN